MSQYKVADLILQVICEDEKIITGFRDYEVTTAKNYDIKISINKRDHIAPRRGSPIKGGQGVGFYKTEGDNGYFILGREKFRDSPLALLEIDGDWEVGNVYYNDIIPQRGSFTSRYYVHHFPGIVHRYNLLKHEGIVVHASSIDWKGKGLLFSAPSGTGKSTHVGLWRDYFGDEVALINDDTPALRFRNGRPFVFGTPWSGNGSNNNICAPLEAVVILEQAPQNAIRKLSWQDAVHCFLPRCFLPFFDENLMNLALDVHERIIRSVPVYLLRCRPDMEAVEMVCRRIKQG